MKCENKVGKSFDNLAQRIIYAYKCTYPDFMPVNHSEVSQESQKQMHGFLGDTLCNIYDDPTIINIKIEPDDYYENNALNKSKPELIVSMKKVEKKLIDFYKLLYGIGESGRIDGDKLYVSKEEFKITRNKLAQLGEVGILSESNENDVILYSEKYPDLFPAFQLLCQTHALEKERFPKGLLMFMYCIYDLENYKAVNIYGDASQNRECISELEDYFQGKSYISLYKHGGLCYEKEHPDKQLGYINISFEWHKKDQMQYDLRVPNFRLLLNHYDEMDDELKGFVFSRTKKCNGCGYCTQTDKSGKRKPLTMALEYNGQTVGKCPLYPNLRWRTINNGIARDMKKIMDFAEAKLYG